MKKNALETIVYQENPVRMQVIDGQLWFVAKDVCDILDLSNPRKAVAALDDDEKGVTTSDTPGGKQQVNIVNESGMYALIFQSRKPSARGFRKWGDVRGAAVDPAVRPLRCAGEPGAAASGGHHGEEGARGSGCGPWGRA